MSIIRSTRHAPLLALVLVSGAACGSSQPSDPVTPAPMPEPATAEAQPEPASDAPLHIGAFTLTIQKEGSQERSVIAGDASGNLSLEKFDASGQSEKKKGGLQVTAEGTLVGDDVPPGTIAIGADGAVMLNGEPTGVVIAADGTVSKDGADMIRFEGNQVVDLADAFKSTVTVNGEATQETRFTVSFEGDQATRRLAAFALMATLVGGKVQAESSAQAPATAVAPVEMKPVKGSKMKPATVKLEEQGSTTSLVGGWFEGLKPGKYLWVIHEKGDGSGNGKKAGPAWSGAAGLQISMEVTKDHGGNIDQGLPIKLADVGGRALVLHQDKKGKPGKAVACGVIAGGPVPPSE